MAHRIIQWFSLLCSCLLFKTVQGQVSHVPAEKGQSATLECKIPTATPVTWKVLTGSKVDDEMSSCNPFSGVCVDKQPWQYQGHITSFSGGYTSTLVISSANTAETQFACWTDNSLVVNISLEVYVLPSTPSCTISWTYRQYSYIDLTCETANVYPSFQARLHRREFDYFNVDPNASRCTVDIFGTGTKGDCYGNCTWRIPFSGMLENNTFYVEMVAVVGNNTPVGTSVFSPDKMAYIRLPKAIIYERNCPVGPGVVGEYIKIGTVATCQCDLVSSELVSGTVRWYTHDGDLVKAQDASRQFSVLSLSYNASDTNQTYDCWAVNPTLESYHVSYTPKFSSQVSHVPAEEGQNATLECKLLTATSVTWKVLSGSQGDVELSSCNATSGVCTDKRPLQFQGNISISPGDNTSTLVISSAKKSETQFTCWTDNGSLAAIIGLGVYVLPSTPAWTISWTYYQYSYIDLTCETDNVYPSFQAILHRRELDHFNVVWNASSCTVYKVGTGTKGDCYGNCTWRIPFSSLQENNTFYVEMFAVVGSNTSVGTSVFSSDKSTIIRLPRVRINEMNCPVGPGVIREYVKIATVATCQCEILSPGEVPGSVRWYTHDGNLVKAQNASRQSSILLFSYNALDTNQTYDCRADNPTAEYDHVSYTPKFSTSPPQSLISGLLFVMGISLALKLA